jgi:hypothetical protein
MKYTTWDFAPKNDFSRKLTCTVERSKEDPPPVWARGKLGLDFDGRRSGSPFGPVEPFGPLEPVGPGDEETVELFDPDPPHDASDSMASDSTRTWRMPAILAPRVRALIRNPDHAADVRADRAGDDPIDRALEAALSR